ncbi:MAG: universal stress protein [Bacteroidia bacterium]|nr:universal stress protein [Bacteroidia bacterium]
MSITKRILFPTDLSEFAAKARENIIALAKLYGASVSLMHVITDDKSESVQMKHLEQEVAEFKKEGILAIPLIKNGKLWKMIVDSAKEVSADMIIFGTKGGSGLRDSLFGSNIVHIIRNAPCPVMTFREKPDHVGFRKILLPLDLTKEVGEKVTWGVQFAKKYGSDLEVFTVLRPGDDKGNDKLLHRMELSREIIEKEGLSVNMAHTVSNGNIADIISDHAKASGSDLVVLMMQQESSGSGTEDIVNKITIPVLAVKPEKAYLVKSYLNHHFT